MAEKPLEERTEAASPRRRQKARDEGQVARSTELTSAAVLAAGLIGMFMGAHTSLELLTGQARSFWAGAAQLSAIELISQTGLAYLLKDLGLALTPLFLSVIAAGLAANLVQVGVLFKAPKFQWSRIDPLQGAKRLLSLRSAMELAKTLAKISLVGAIGVWTVFSDIGTLLPLADSSLGTVVAATTGILGTLAFRMTLAIAAIAVIDIAYTRWQHERDIRMSRQEVRDETKELEGDPQIKARVRRIQQEQSQRRMMQEVPGATVVVTNPTHYAVALAYKDKKDPAPRVVAKGTDHVAAKIREIATDAEVPIIQDPPTARALHANCELGDPIPQDLYQAVAEILAVVYRSSGPAQVTQETAD